MKKLLRKITAVLVAAGLMLPAGTEMFGFDFGTAIVASADTVGNFTVTGGESGTDYTYADHVLTIKTATPITISGTTTTDTIVVEKNKNANITLDGVNIDVSATGDADNGTAGSAAFKIADNSTGDVTITLADGSVNTLKGGVKCAGLQKNGEYSATLGKLTIRGGTNGTGKLTATGGYNGGAGIGGSLGNGSNITISGGTVTATGGLYSAGIGGGGSHSSGSNIKINGGTVTANGCQGGAGIGGGGGAGSYITINGGTVTANGGNNGGSGIGGGSGGNGSNITISGGTVTATGGENGAGIGGGSGRNGSNIIISGGSVKASGANAIGGGKNGNGAVPPTSDGSTPVYLLPIANPNSEAVYIDGVSYTPVNHKAADRNDTNLYAYLTGNTHMVKVGGKIIRSTAAITLLPRHMLGLQYM